MSSTSPGHVTGAYLLQREESEGDAYPNNLRLRVHRAISWVRRAEMAAVDGDPDVAFTCHWIAFNAAYAVYSSTNPEGKARERFGEYFSRLLELDKTQTIHNAIWDRFSVSIRNLLENRYVFEPFWRDAHRGRRSRRWRDEFERELSGIEFALAAKQSEYVLEKLFDRLYVLRNQILHGGATWSSSLNRKQVEDGAEIMAFLVPCFVSVMMDHPDEPWGANYYPVVE